MPPDMNEIHYNTLIGNLKLLWHCNYAL